MTDAHAGSAPAVPTPAALPRPTGHVAGNPANYGSIDPDGCAYVNTPEGPVLVGQWAAGTPAEGLAFFGRKFDDLETERALIAQRLGDGHISPQQARESLKRVEESLDPPQCIGDIAGLRQRIADLHVLINDLAEVRAAERAAQKAQALTRRTELVDQAEALATSQSWKTTSEAFAAIVEEWKALPRADRAVEQDLWKRLSAARTAFDKRRRAHFAERESARKSALQAKRTIIAKAEELATSTDWAGTSRAFKTLLQEWKVAPRGSKADEDKLWKRFRAAQDAFFAARTTADAERDAALEPNIEPKRALVAEAEALLPITDIPAAKKSLRDIQRRWDAIGDIPMAERKALEGKLAKVEDALRKAEQQSWHRSNPEGLARAESTISAFDDALAKLKADHDAAVAKGDASKAASLQSRIDQTEGLKAAAERAAQDFR
jgi:hypothetical protein